jgi:hypothetical protein
MAAVRNALVRVARAWRALAPDQRLAAVAAIGLLVSMFLPWYQKNVVVDGRIVAPSITAFGVLSFIEAAIFLISVGVLALLFLRAERRAFHLPGGDGTVVFAAGLWAAFLLFVRVFSRPEVHGNGGTVGIQWGFFIAFVAAGALAYAGWRMRLAARAEPTAAQDPTTRVEPAPPRRPPAPAPRPRAGAAAGASPRQRPRRRPAGPEAPTQIAGQLSFEEDDDLPPPPAWDDPPRPARGSRRGGGAGEGT